MTCGKKILMVLAAALAVAAPAYAITGGSPDGNAHPAVGVVVADNGELCSGFLVSPDTFITAAHCFVGAGPVVRLSFDSVLAGPKAIGIAAPDPAFAPTSPKDTHDLAVVHIVRWAPGAAAPGSYFQLPTLGLLDSKDVRSATVVDVGYGLTDYKHPELFDGVRRVATSYVTNVKDTELRLQQHPGGVCFGDSGGPHLLGNVALAVTSSGNKTCNGQSLNYRLDSPSARAFLQSQGVAVP